MMDKINTLDFSKLMHAWHLAKCNVDLRGDIESIQEEKDCYGAILDYIAAKSSERAIASIKSVLKTAKEVDNEFEMNDVRWTVAHDMFRNAVQRIVEVGDAG